MHAVFILKDVVEEFLNTRHLWESKGETGLLSYGH